jgi:hypothetical protein
MLDITDEAKATLKTTLDGSGQEGHVFRLGRQGSELAINISGPEEGDKLYDLDGEPVLAVPEDLAEELDATIDIEHTSEGAKLILT